MSTQPSAMPGSSVEAQVIAPAAVSTSRPLYWSVRREIWENRSLYLAPLSVAGVILLGFLIRLAHLPERTRAALALELEKQRAMLIMPYDVAAALIMATAFIVGVFYCLDALYGERRDRSILFWKSLPVSDLTTVLSKTTIPLVVLPAIVFVVIVATQMVMLVLNTMALLGSGVSAAPLWEQMKFFQSSVAMLYALIAIALWHAPIYAWLLLVSAWARRTPFLWAILPLFGISILEKIAFNTTHFPKLLAYRFLGWFGQAFSPALPKGSAALNPLSQLTPIKFLDTPGLWLGLTAAAIFVAVAVRMRRYREPI
jgi:ABC-2 type transport system permease protein